MLGTIRALLLRCIIDYTQPSLLVLRKAEWIVWSIGSLHGRREDLMAVPVIQLDDSRSPRGQLLEGRGDGIDSSPVCSWIAQAWSALATRGRHRQVCLPHPEIEAFLLGDQPEQGADEGDGPGYWRGFSWVQLEIC